MQPAGLCTQLLYGLYVITSPPPRACAQLPSMNRTLCTPSAASALWAAAVTAAAPAALTVLLCARSWSAHSSVLHCVLGLSALPCCWVPFATTLHSRHNSNTAWHVLGAALVCRGSHAAGGLHWHPGDACSACALQQLAKAAEAVAGEPALCTRGGVGGCAPPVWCGVVVWHMARFGSPAAVSWEGVGLWRSSHAAAVAVWRQGPSEWALRGTACGCATTQHEPRQLVHWCPVCEWSWGPGCCPGCCCGARPLCPVLSGMMRLLGSRRRWQELAAGILCRGAALRATWSTQHAASIGHTTCGVGMACC
jgi:hypothetical protein